MNTQRREEIRELVNELDLFDSSAATKCKTAFLELLAYIDTLEQTAAERVIADGSRGPTPDYTGEGSAWVPPKVKPHTFAQMVNEVRDLAFDFGTSEQFRDRVADLLGKYIPVEHNSKGVPESADRPIPDGCVRIEIDVSTKCEFTAIPWWFIVDPRQNMSCDLYAAARQITGPFFSREEGEAFLQRAKHHFSSRAAVWCHTGSDARQYAQAFRAALKANEKGLIPKGYAT